MLLWPEHRYTSPKATFSKVADSPELEEIWMVLPLEAGCFSRSRTQLPDASAVADAATPSRVTVMTSDAAPKPQSRGANGSLCRTMFDETALGSFSAAIDGVNTDSTDRPNFMMRNKSLWHKALPLHVKT